MGDICDCIDPEDDIEFEYYSNIAEDDTSFDILRRKTETKK